MGQHSAASLLTSVASASFAMASIEGLPPAVTVTVSSTTAAVVAASMSPPTVTSGAVASATVALLPSSMAGGDAASVMETKCTQTKLEDKELSDFLPAATDTATTTMITTTTTTSSEVANISDAKVETATDLMTSVAKPVDKPAVAASNAAVGGVGLAGPPDPSGLVDVVVAAG